jgi:DNA-binding NarL/FixJ family response regulator
MSVISILIVDDHAMVRQGLGLALQLHADLKIIGEARNGSEGVALAQALKPDVMLLDLSMPDFDGIEVTRKVRSLSPGSKILILSGIHADARIFATVDAGVDGYIVKDATTAELVEAIRIVASGENYFHPSITTALVRYTRKSSQPASPPQETLTGRELDVLRLMATSATNRAIAKQLHVSEETVRTHVKNILRKLEKPNRTQAVLEGIRRGLVTLA